MSFKDPVTDKFITKEYFRSLVEFCGKCDNTKVWDEDIKKCVKLKSKRGKKLIVHSNYCAKLSKLGKNDKVMMDKLLDITITDKFNNPIKVRDLFIKKADHIGLKVTKSIGGAILLSLIIYALGRISIDLKNDIKDKWTEYKRNRDVKERAGIMETFNTVFENPGVNKAYTKSGYFQVFKTLAGFGVDKEKKRNDAKKQAIKDEKERKENENFLKMKEIDNINDYSATLSTSEIPKDKIDRKEILEYLKSRNLYTYKDKGKGVIKINLKYINLNSPHFKDTSIKIEKSSYKKNYIYIATLKEIKENKDISFNLKKFTSDDITTIKNEFDNQVIVMIQKIKLQTNVNKKRIKNMEEYRTILRKIYENSKKHGKLFQKQLDNDDKISKYKNMKTDINKKLKNTLKIYETKKTDIKQRIDDQEIKIKQFSKKNESEKIKSERIKLTNTLNKLKTEYAIIERSIKDNKIIQKNNENNFKENTKIFEKEKRENKKRMEALESKEKNIRLKKTSKEKELNDKKQRNIDEDTIENEYQNLINESDFLHTLYKKYLPIINQNIGRLDRKNILAEKYFLQNDIDNFYKYINDTYTDEQIKKPKVYSNPKSYMDIDTIKDKIKIKKNQITSPKSNSNSGTRQAQSPNSNSGSGTRQAQSPKSNSGSGSQSTPESGPQLVKDIKNKKSKTLEKDDNYEELRDYNSISTKKEDLMKNEEKYMTADGKRDLSYRELNDQYGDGYGGNLLEDLRNKKEVFDTNTKKFMNLSERKKEYPEITTILNVKKDNIKYKGNSQGNTKKAGLELDIY